MTENGAEIKGEPSYAIKTRHLITAGLILPMAAIASHLVVPVLYLYVRPHELPVYLWGPMGLVASFGPLLGLVSGYWALRRLYRYTAPGRQRALLAVWLGWLSLAALCISTVAPVVMKEQEAHQAVRSRANLKAIGVAIALYRTDCGYGFPPAFQVLADKKYVKDLSIFSVPPLWPWSKRHFMSPAAIDAESDYAYAPLLREPPRPGDAPIAWEKDTSECAGRGANTLFADFHVSSKDTGEILTLLARYRSYYAAEPQPPKEQDD